MNAKEKKIHEIRKITQQKGVPHGTLGAVLILLVCAGAYTVFSYGNGCSLVDKCSSVTCPPNTEAVTVQGADGWICICTTRGHAN